MAQRVDDARHPEARERDLTERSRDRILGAALEEFASRGFEGTTTAEVARRAGVTQPLVHYHFDTKETLWRAAVELAFAGIADAFDGVLEELADLGTIDQMKVLLRRFVRFTGAHPELSRIVAHEGSAGGPRLDWLLNHHLAGQFEPFRDLYERAVLQGVARPLRTDLLVTAVVAAVAHVFMIPATMREVYGIDVRDPAVVDAQADTVVELFFEGLVLPAASGAGVAS